MTARILSGSTVRYLDHDCEALSMICKAGVFRCNLRCGSERFADIPAGLLVLIAPPPAIPKFRLEGLR